MPRVYDKGYERLVAEETLIVEATEELCRVMEGEDDSGEITRKQLAERLGQTKSHVTQLLSGERNMTLRTLAQMADALGHRVEVALKPLPAPPGQKSANSSSSTPLLKERKADGC